MKEGEACSECELCLSQCHICKTKGSQATKQVSIVFSPAGVAPSRRTSSPRFRTMLSEVFDHCLLLETNDDLAKEDTGRRRTSMLKQNAKM